MNIKRIIFWVCFVVVLGLIIWGMTVAANKQVTPGDLAQGTPAPVAAEDHVQGPSNAPVTLIEYSDFQCPACENYYFIVTKLIEEASSSIRFVYRHYPLPQHANAIAAAVASEAASSQGKFWPMYDLVFTNHTDWTEEADPTKIFIGYASKIGLDVPRFTTDLKDSKLRDKVMANLAEGQGLGINSTPTFFVNGKAIKNPQSYAEFKALIDKAASSNPS